MRISACCPARSPSEIALIAVLALGVASACSIVSPRPEVVIKGSDTMLELNRRLAEAFMRAHSGIAVRVEGGSTGAGVAALVAGTVDLCAASRPFTSREVAALHGRSGTLGVRVLVARDALSVYLHPSNAVEDLTMIELRDLFAGVVTDWSEVGGAEAAVVPVVRPPSSGPYRFFRDRVLGGLEYAPKASTAVRTADVVARVKDEPGAIGYGAIIYGRDLVHCRLDGVAPTIESVRDGSYPLARYLYLYAASPPTGAMRQFTDWCATPAGQQVVADVGFVRLWGPSGAELGP
jgi:phosphate transport system substrate-binding protein